MKTVLVVDPDVKSRQEILGALPTKDVNAVEMEDGMDVLRYLKSNSVDVIISEGFTVLGWAGFKAEQKNTMHNSHRFYQRVTRCL